MPRLGSPRSAPSRLSLVASAKTPPHQINGRQCFGGGNVWSCPLDGLDGKPSLANVVLTGRLSRTAARRHPERETLELAAAGAAKVLGPEYSVTKALARAATTMAKVDLWRGSGATVT